MSEEEDNPPLVLDIGSGMVKAGFAGDDAPISVFPSVCGKPKYPLAIDCYRENYVGDNVTEHKGVLSINHPIKHGVVTNWDDMESILRHIFYNELRVSPFDQPVLVTEPPLNPKSNREIMTQTMFEQFEVPAFFMANPGILASYSSGRGTGLILDCGDGVVHTIPIYEGYTIPHSIRRQNFAGGELTAFLQRILQSRGYTFSASNEMETVKDIKEKLCYVALDYKKELMINEQSSHIKKSYELPDGNRVVFDEERFTCPESLFQPHLHGLTDGKGVHELVYETLMDCDMDTRRDFYTNIIIAGGSTMFPGFAERLTQEIKKLIPERMICKVVSPPERKFSVWIGGSILASLSTFSEMWISKEEYEEHGPNIIHRKVLL